MGHKPELDPRNLGKNPYPGFQPELAPFHFQVIGGGGRPETGDPLYTSPADGLELLLISLQLAGPDHYSTWARDFRRALVTKDKDGFIDRTIPFPADNRTQRLWHKCNQLVRTWIGNCVTPKVATGLPPTEDLKVMWDNIHKMYEKLNRVKKKFTHSSSVGIEAREPLGYRLLQLTFNTVE